MATYGIYRLGANASNQGMRDRMLVAIVEAKSRDQACEVDGPERPDLYSSNWLKLDPEVSIWANQSVEAVPLSRVPAADRREYEESRA